MQLSHESMYRKMSRNLLILSFSFTVGNAFLLNEAVIFLSGMTSHLQFNSCIINQPTHFIFIFTGNRTTASEKRHIGLGKGMRLIEEQVEYPTRLLHQRETLCTLE